MFMERCATTDVGLLVNVPIELIIEPITTPRQRISWSIAAIWDLLDTNNDNTNGRPPALPTGFNIFIYAFYFNLTE